MILGASVAERAGAVLRADPRILRNAPKAILTPIVAIIGMVSHHASDAAYVVFIPLAAITFAAVGRHPIAGLAAAFAGVSGRVCRQHHPWADGRAPVRLHAGGRAHPRAGLDHEPARETGGSSCPS
jgi:p-aminobenzoyl-glutamate transporter AbgT